MRFNLIDNIGENHKDIINNKNVNIKSHIDEDIRTVGFDINVIKKSRRPTHYKKKKA